MNQYWINVLNSAHTVSIILSIFAGISTISICIWYVITYKDKDFSIPSIYPLVSSILFILFLLLFVFTSPIN